MEKIKTNEQKYISIKYTEQENLEMILNYFYDNELFIDELVDYHKGMLCYEEQAEEYCGAYETFVDAEMWKVNNTLYFRCLGNNSQYVSITMEQLTPKEDIFLITIKETSIKPFHENHLSGWTQWRMI